MFKRLREMDWTFLLACIAWGLTTALMLYVKLRKKTESFPVLILVAVFLLYMNSGDLFKNSRLYTIACVNRRVLVHQFVTLCVFGFLSNSYSDIFVVLLLMSAVVLRPGWDLGKTGIPIVGSFLVTPSRRTLVALGLAAQCFGFFTGTVLGIAMIDRKSSGATITASHADISDAMKTITAFTLVLVGTNFVKLTPKWRGRISTVIGSGIIAAVSRVIPFYNSPLAVVPVIALVCKLFPGAVVSISEFIPQLVNAPGSKIAKLKIFVSVGFLHACGALVAGYFSPSMNQAPEFVSRKAIAQELFFSTILAFVVTRRPNMAPLVYLASFLATVGSDMVHMCSSISLGAEALGNGRLIARLLWQSVGALIGASLLAPLVDSERIDFDPITSVTRTTDGRVINNARASGK
jgi:hypothetical protein